VERAVSRHREHLPAAVRAAGRPAAPAGPERPASIPAPPRAGKIARRTRERHAGVHRMLAEGRNFREIARELGLSRNTVRRFARADSP
jgi:DNA-binding NarL/FixJ family response regulator